MVEFSKSFFNKCFYIKVIIEITNITLSYDHNCFIESNDRINLNSTVLSHPPH